MVAQTSSCLQYHTTRIKTISGNNLSVVYLSTNEKNIIHQGLRCNHQRTQDEASKENALDHLRQANQKKDSLTKNGLEQGNSLVELIEDAHTSYVNNFNVWKKKIINKISLEKQKILRKTIPWCNEGEVQTTLSEVICFPVSLTILGLVHTPEDAIQGLNQPATKVELHDNSRITKGHDYKTVWCPRTVYKNQDTWADHAEFFFLNTSTTGVCIQSKEPKTIALVMGQLNGLSRVSSTVRCIIHSRRDMRWGQ